MPRKARLDAFGTLHHVIIRGIERRAIEIGIGVGPSIILISIKKHSRNRCFQPQERRFRHQNRSDIHKTS
jgi:hypothetical protein